MNHLNEMAKISTAGSFAISTILLALLLYFGVSNFPVDFGLVFIIVAFSINLVLFIILMGYAIFNPKQRLETLKTCGIILLNIPVVIFYTYLIIIL